jgi:membrane associated rhomboid family serine protease
MGGMPPATLVLLIANVALFLLGSLVGVDAFGPLALWPLGSYFEPFQVVTYAFLHGSFAHLFFNMFALYMFGGPLERLWGTPKFVSFYFASVLAAAAAQLAVTAASGSEYPTVGASGGVFGLLLGFALMFPRERLAIYGILPMPAWLLVTLYGLLELYLGVTGTLPGVAHFAHLGGMAGGALILLLWRGHARPPSSPRPVTRRTL